MLKEPVIGDNGFIGTPPLVDDNHTPMMAIDHLFSNSDDNPVTEEELI